MTARSLHHQPPHPSIGELEILRYAANLHQYSVAHALGWGRGVLGAYIVGRHDPQLRRAEEWASFLGYTYALTGPSIQPPIINFADMSTTGLRRYQQLITAELARRTETDPM